MPLQNASDEYEVKLPFGAPPILPDVEKQLKEYLTCPERLPVHDYKAAQKFWPRTTNPASLYHYESAPVATILRVERHPGTGEIVDLKEVFQRGIGCTGQNSTSLKRAPGPQNEIHGNRDNFPFLPGGFSELSLFTEDMGLNAELDFEKDLLTTPPGLERGVLFKADGKTPRTEIDKEPQQVAEAGPAEGKAEEQIQEPKKEDEIVTNLMSIVKQEEDLLGLWRDESVVQENKEQEHKMRTEIAIETLEVEAEILPKEDTIPMLKITETPTIGRTLKTEWAEVLDISIPIIDFGIRIPNMAKTWHFPLDNFQKQAILKLEERSHVFVAAHTSAGKTVVAEYAIALSQKHMTRAIYTSPIKALSNQKYRDFKDEFEDVGLITGDLQINPTAQCLIMTTEILQRMLYCGSEIVRDLEYVIFDEVHYINDKERGHVWEEVLILLPPHVTIVMLSATVPNTLEFADWVGRTKQKKVYVISTPKRPVPLEHFLYTSIGRKPKDECFLIMDENSRFIEDGYDAAVSAKKKSKSSHSQKLSPSQETTMWLGLIEYLQRKEKLPVVAFTLSRNRCDMNTENLGSVDLTTAQEKRIIISFVRSCVKCLRPPDQELPQVIKLADLLERGIGVHHSGILPVLKEIVEILFQKSLVKLLFATETFAMGVNMPARTVVFDSIEKYDGVEKRELHPSEYIQMAGRAGRRGIDKIGTVIILCKTEVPSRPTLQAMMLRQPTKLVSNFRITYSMILNLCRVETITVENMMSHSFKQFAHLGTNKLKLEKLTAAEEKLLCNQKEHLPKATGTLHTEMCDFYATALDYIQLWEKTIVVRSRPFHLEGRVVLISHKEHIRKLGLVLSAEKTRTERVYKVLVLCNSETERTADEEIKLSVVEQKKPVKDEQDPLWYKMLSLAKTDLFVPDGIGAHTVLEVKNTDIIKLSRRTLKVNCQLVYNDWDKRQMPRFKDCAPSQTCITAVQKLTELTHNVMSGSECLSVFDEVHLQMGEDFGDSMMVEVDRMALLETKLGKFTCTKLPNFEQLFERVFIEKQLEEIGKQRAYLTSIQSFEQYEEFQRKIEVLKSLRFIDSNNKIELKGRVACGMGTNELLLTEMVLENILSEKHPAEIAALLSCLVFQQRTERPVGELTGSLNQGIKDIQEIAEHIKDTERICRVMVNESEEFRKISFGLVQVVHDWAMGEPFASIMKNTDVQEGVIVRCIQQLHEVIQDVKKAANSIGDTGLKLKMEVASELIKRDIVFAASLYTSEEAKELRARFQKVAEEGLIPQ